MANGKRAGARESTRGNGATDLSFLEEMIEGEPIDLVRPYLEQAGIEQSEVRFHVYRKVEDGRKPDAFLFKCPPEDFDHSEIGQLYGSGTYRLRIFVRDASAPNGVIRGGGLFTIEMPAGWKPRPPEAAPAPGHGTLETLLLEQARRSDERLERILEAMANKSGAPSPLETLEGLSKLAEIIKPAAPAPSAATLDFTTVLNAAQALTNLAGKGGANDGDADTVLFRSGLGVIEKMIDRAMSARAAPAAAAPVSHAGPAAAALPPAAEQPRAPAPATEEEEGMLVFRAMIRRACGAAAAREDAALFADDAFPFISVEDLTTLALERDWFALLVKAVPDCSHYQEWFTQVRARVIDLGVEQGLLLKLADGTIAAAPPPPPPPPA